LRGELKSRIVQLYGRDWRSSNGNFSQSQSRPLRHAFQFNEVAATTRRKKIGTNRCPYRNEELPSESKISAAPTMAWPSRNGAPVPTAARPCCRIAPARIVAFTAAARSCKSKKV